MENNKRKLDDLLSRAQDPNRIKTAKEFMADKKQEEMNESMSMGYISENIVDDDCVEICVDEDCAPQACVPDTCDPSSSHGEQTSSSI
jgi:hypothetical protein